jgi:hypothetical protein
MYFHARAIVVQIFEILEGAKVDLALEEYGVRPTFRTNSHPDYCTSNLIWLIWGTHAEFVFSPSPESRDLFSMSSQVCQTTLEQIFNAFAAQQDEETGPVRGVQVRGAGNALATALTRILWI